jgi:murein endopeptidase
MKLRLMRVEDAGVLVLVAMLLVVVGGAYASAPRGPAGARRNAARARTLALSRYTWAQRTRAPVWAVPKPRHASVPIGPPDHGRLLYGVQLPANGPGFTTANASAGVTPNPGWRRWGTDKMIALLERVAVEFGAAHPRAAPLVIGDIAKHHGGPFGVGLGVEGHASHQNGRDADVYYPRKDRRPIPPTSVGQIDHALAQDLVNRFVRAGVMLAFVGPHTGLKGPRGVVEILWNHDNHVHIRIPWPYRGLR